MAAEGIAADRIHFAGNVMIGLGGALMILGGVWLRRVVRVVF